MRQPKHKILLVPRGTARRINRLQDVETQRRAKTYAHN